MTTHTRNIVIKNNLVEIEILTSEIQNFCKENGLNEDVCYDLRLALEEAVSNTIKYGYDDQGVHEILIRAGLENQDIFLEIEDDAKEFNPLEMPDPNLSLPLERKTTGGLGIFLLRAVMDHVEHKRSGSKNILRMTKSVRRN